MIEHELERTASRIRIAIDPHNGHCRGAHDVIVEATKLPGVADLHVTYSWGPSIVLSAQGTAEFRDALSLALERGEELRRELGE